ncbi:Rpn family recombination-promoting nuclease/putative transposase [uncultured Treponema sp.]|uniref:Rpn family recombination-promoting nuclease/putative transposase n=1 Tax=uncultured Treponema sp. TaxID=162155 RepID=UPI0025DC3111|nr:Rpn family recombination-promoting nuclease/putative transposase [uncultured Treponema sp.]
MKNNEIRLLNPRLDPNFKAMFTQKTEESRMALKSFLTAVIGRKISHVTVIENEDARCYDMQRGIDFDINCIFSDGACAQIEMQSFYREYDYGKRAEYYAARLASSTMKTGEEWEKVPQVYQISVMDFTYDKTNKNPIHHYSMTDLSDGAKLSGILNVIFLELTKLPKIKDLASVKNLPSAIKWCKFLKMADKPDSQKLIRELVNAEEGIMNAEKALEGISMDRWRWIIQGQIEGRKRDEFSAKAAQERKDREIEQKKKEQEQKARELEQKGREQEQKAREQEQREKELVRRAEELALREEKLARRSDDLHREKLATAQRALDMGISPEQVAKATELSIEEILSLKNE